MKRTALYTVTVAVENDNKYIARCPKLGISVGGFSAGEVLREVGDILDGVVGAPEPV